MASLSLLAGRIVGILINPTVSYTYKSIQNYTEIIPGTMQTLEIIVNDEEMNLINSYGHDNEDGNFFEQLEKHLKTTKKNLIIFGDFNTKEKLDKRNGSIDTHKRLVAERLLTTL